VGSLAFTHCPACSNHAVFSVLVMTEVKSLMGNLVAGCCIKHQLFDIIIVFRCGLYYDLFSALYQVKVLPDYVIKGKN